MFGAELEGIEDLIPLEWNKKVYVERYEAYKGLLNGLGLDKE